MAPGVLTPGHVMSNGPGVAVWLIAVSLFRHGEGIAEIADIELRGGGGGLRVL